MYDLWQHEIQLGCLLLAHKFLLSHLWISKDELLQVHLNLSNNLRDLKDDIFQERYRNLHHLLS